MTEEHPDVAGGRLAIGIDVGGSGIKAAVVDVDDGRFRSERLRIATPVPATPEAVIASIGRIVRRLAKAGGLGTSTPVGVGLPGVTMDDTLKFAGNIDQAWIGFPVVERLRKVTGRPVSIVNDADAAGIAEMRFGIGRGRPGVVIFLTLGTGRRLRRLRRRHPRPEHRIRADGDSRSTGRAPVGGRRSPSAGPVMEGMGAGPRRASRPDRQAHVAEPDDPRRRREQAE